MITEIEAYFAKGCGRCPRFATPDCSALRWAEGLAALRALCLGAGLTETVKWGQPCYTHAGRNIAILGAFRGDFRLTLFDAARLSAPEGLLTRQGPNSQTPDAIRFTAADQVQAHAAAITALLVQSQRLGKAEPRAPAAFDLPEALRMALAQDPALAEAFQRLTPGRQRSHALHVGSAKALATQQARIAKLRPRILAGKGATEA
ncbi:MAG: YdeI/OmpD-associated family protein [Gemmobacter sp.]|uniref:YdeI/OmpD-associated family protein n=1 Tax=Gemmobacter sp. TaxID=1898957 RepID=UPI001A4F342D|nr:YdeI/OmpD-associated family protein [Gemmobacter sp.]MBL8563344.1 YdeI/OmpD-associated family protein [Gemmobacter sp.]